MLFSVASLRKENLGQIASLDVVNEQSGHEHHIMGELQSIERTPDQVILSIGGTDIELSLNAQVDLVKSPELRELTRIKPTEVENLTMALQRETPLKVALEELVRQTVTDALSQREVSAA